jgi:hypothetical protein
VGTEVIVGIIVSVGGKKVAVGDSIAFTPQAERANPADVTPASLRKSRRDIFLLIFSYLCFARGVPTVCVTRAGAGGGTPSDWKNVEA